MSLSRLHFFNQAATECCSLFSILDGSHPHEMHAYIYEHIVPFELEVLKTCIAYWEGDVLSYLDTLLVLLRRCKSAAGSPEETSMWKERAARILLIQASQLLEMKVLRCLNIGKLLDKYKCILKFLQRSCCCRKLEAAHSCALL